METLKALNSQSNIEKEKWSQRKSGSLISGHITKLQSSKQHGTGTKTEIQINGQNKNPRNKTMNLQSINLQHRKQDYTAEKRQFLQWCWKNWTATCKKMKQTFFNIIHKNKFKMDQRHKCKAGYYKTRQKSKQYIF